MGLDKANPTYLYEGTILDGSFTMNKKTYKRDNFIPVVKGQFSDSLGPTQIHIKMRPQISIIILAPPFLLFSFILAVALFIFSIYVSSGFVPYLPFVTPPILGVNALLGTLFPDFFFFVFYFGIKSLTKENKNTKAFLKSLLEGAEPVKAPSGIPNMSKDRVLTSSAP